MEKLGQLYTQAEADGRWNLIIVDTPPARSALDFLDAPEHLSSLLDGRFLRLLLAPARGPFKLMSVGFNLVSSAMNKVLGAQIITDLKTFVTAFEALFGGFRVRAQQTIKILSSSYTTFLVVATAERDALREAAYFVDRLTEERMPLSGIVVNRVHRSTVDTSAERALAIAEELTGSDSNDTRPEIAALTSHAARMRVIDREQTLLRRFSRSRRQLALTQVEALPSDVSDLSSLRELGDLLAEQD